MPAAHRNERPWGFFPVFRAHVVSKPWGAACKNVAVERGLGGGAPDAPATYSAMGHLYFDSVETFQAAFVPHAEAIMADIPSFTNVQPTVQVSEVKL